MNNSLGTTMAARSRLLAGPLICILSACALPAIAAPGDTLLAPGPPETGAVDQPAGSTVEYLRIAGSTFHPLDNTTTYTYPGGGCITRTGGPSSLFAHRVILPEGAVARVLRLYYYDTSSQDVLSFFTTYDGAGNFDQRVSVSSAGGASGYGSAPSTDMNFTVDRYISAINITVNLGTQNDDTLQFCGVRISYTPPITDRIFANGFDFTPL